jgi:hypothetical protein
MRAVGARATPLLQTSTAAKKKNIKNKTEKKRKRKNEDKEQLQAGYLGPWIR